ncbi:MAG: N-acetyl-alpha-D-glucosaminyl L-malate synthase BshA [Acidobacteria bacterium]|nr:N-acetyl-alpha-D-glucosaminyl L-malate synthase BshA [Acidobacteriota bacterium]
MRIGITCYPTYGGSGIVATELGKELAARGHEIHFITYAPPLRLRAESPNIHFHEVETASYPLFNHPPYTLSLATMMADVATAHKLDLLHCHYAIPHSVSAFLAKSMLEPRRLPVVTTLHGTDITLVGADRSYLPITRFSIEKSDAVTAVSQYLRNATYRTFGVKKEIDVIYNFVNCERCGSERGKRLRDHFAPNGERILIHLSNFRPVKRPVDVVEIFNIVQSQLPAVLLMVGDGPERSNAEHLVSRYALGSKAHFLGKRDDIEELTACAHLLLLPSDNESFGLAALEAMASAVPVLVSNVGGLPEVVTDGVDGHLVEPRNVEEMARRAVEILSDEARRIRMGERAREKARTRFSSSAIIPQYEELYRRILSDASA